MDSYSTKKVLILKNKKIKDFANFEQALKRRPLAETTTMSILNPPLMVYNNENRASLQKLPDKSQISGKRLLEIVKKEKH